MNKNNRRIMAETFKAVLSAKANQLLFSDQADGELELIIDRPDKAARALGDVDMIHLVQDRHCIALTRDGLEALHLAVGAAITQLDNETAKSSKLDA